MAIQIKDTTASFRFTVPTIVKFGCGTSEEIGSVVKELAVKQVLCIYDEGIKNSGIADQIINQLHLEELQVVAFEKVTANPTDSIVTEAAEFAKEHEVEAIIAIGGGSSIDCAKAVNILLTNPGSIHQYEGRDTVKIPTKPLIAIPTTSGTGSEVTAVTVITDSKKSRKMVIGGQHCGATIALVDPLLTVGLPPAVTAGTGMDALTHAIEAYISKGASVMTDINALKAIELISGNIYESTSNGTNIEARSNMLLGSLIAGVAFDSAGLGLVHAISHPISSHCGVPHGTANAILLPHVLAFNGVDERVRRQMRDVASSMGLPNHGIDDQEIVKSIVEKVTDLNHKVNIPRLREAGVKKENFTTIAEDALKERSMTFTPRTATKEDIMAILENAY